MTLAELGEALAYEIGFDFASGADEPGHAERMARVTAPKLRALAAIVLLTRGDVQRFHGNLRAAAELWRDHLRAARETNEDTWRRSGYGHSQGLFDALAGGSLPLAREIAALAPPVWARGFEYEDDFCWARLIGLLVIGRPAEAELQVLIERLQACLQGQPSARLDLAPVLQRRQAGEFGAPFEALLQERALELHERLKAGELDDAASLVERRVFVEGLALLALADTWGLRAERNYRFCPALARLSLALA
jgi:hypothetical protein